MIGQLSNPWWVFVVLGLCAGVLSGALGLGSGIILVPTLVLLCSFGQKNAQGMALAVMVPMALLGALRYWKNPEIDIHALSVGLIICGALVGVLVGTELAFRVPGHILGKVLAAVLVIVAIKLFMTSAKPGQPNLDNPDTSGIEQKVVSSLVRQAHHPERSRRIEHGETNNEPEI